MSQDIIHETIDEDRDEFSINVPSPPYGVFGVLPTCGFLHKNGERWIVTSDDYEVTVQLPDYIKSRQSALTFIRHSHEQLRIGVEFGAKAKEHEVSNKVAKTLGLATIERVDRLQQDLDKLQERLFI